MAKIEPMEERLTREWGLMLEGKIIANKIRDKIFEKDHEMKSLKSLLDTKKLVVCSYALGRLLSSQDVGLKSSQLRRFYESLVTLRTMVNSIRTKQNANEIFINKVLPGIVMLKPQLANAKARQPGQVGPFFEVINPLIDRVVDVEDYDLLCKFVEAVVAYHKFCGGRD